MSEISRIIPLMFAIMTLFTILLLGIDVIPMAIETIINEAIPVETVESTGPSILFIMLIIVGILALIGVLIALYQYKTYTKIKNKIIAFKAKRKLRKRAGYKAYRNAIKLQKILNIQQFYVEKGNDEILTVFAHISEIIRVYIANIDEHDITMYKYEPTFEQMLKLMTHANKENMIEDNEILSTLMVAIAYPYQEIVGEGIASAMTKPMKQEIQILKDLNKA